MPANLYGFKTPFTVALIAFAGIGSRTALHLAKMGATVVMACRSVQKGEEARAALEKEMRSVLPRGLSSLCVYFLYSLTLYRYGPNMFFSQV